MGGRWEESRWRAVWRGVDEVVVGVCWLVGAGGCLCLGRNPGSAAAGRDREGLVR